MQIKNELTKFNSRMDSQEELEIKKKKIKKNLRE